MHYRSDMTIYLNRKCIQACSIHKYCYCQRTHPRINIYHLGKFFYHHTGCICPLQCRTGRIGQYKASKSFHYDSDVQHTDKHDSFYWVTNSNSHCIMCKFLKMNNRSTLPFSSRGIVLFLSRCLSCKHTPSQLERKAPDIANSLRSLCSWDNGNYKEGTLFPSGRKQVRICRDLHHQ